MTKTADRTGVEMEALTAVAVAGLTLHDMVKAVDPAAVLTDVRVLEKSGGRSGDWERGTPHARLPPRHTAAAVRPRLPRTSPASARALPTAPSLASSPSPIGPSPASTRDRVAARCSRRCWPISASSSTTSSLVPDEADAVADALRDGGRRRRSTSS